LLLAPRQAPVPRAGAARLARGLTAVLFVMILTGGLVAGTRAGFAFGTWPLMLGRLVPPGLFAQSPWWANLHDNILTVQFTHRMLAYAVALGIGLAWLRLRSLALPADARLALNLLPVALVLQIGLGVATLLSAVATPIASTHQAGALVVFTLALGLEHLLSGSGPPAPGTAAARKTAG